MTRLRIFLFAAAALGFARGSAQTSADLMLYNGKVYTLDSAFSTAEAVVVRGGRILATGTTSGLRARYRAKRSVDLHGLPLYPGFQDAHAHFVDYAGTLFCVQLYGCASWDEVLARVKTFAAAHAGAGWIIGYGWDQNLFPGQSFPDNAALSLLFPDRPVLLHRVDGHAALANEKALALAGVQPGDSMTGGVFETKKGRLTGLLIDNAVGRVAQRVPPPTASEMAFQLAEAEKKCFAAGLTTITDCGLTWGQANLLDSLQKAGRLRMRLVVLLGDDPENFRLALARGVYRTERLRVGGFKLYADGALGSRGACLLAPYTDRPGWSGFLLSPAAHFDSVARLLIHSGFQVCTHAIGDSGNRMILQTYARYLPEHNDLRWRVEHAQVVSPDDMALFGRYAIVPSVQPTHATSDMGWAGERLGPDRLKNAYAYRDLLAQNGWLPLGTDFPVEDISPMKTFHAAVFRTDTAGKPAGGFEPENALTRRQTLCGMTIWAARAAFTDGETGSLEPGKQADFVVLDHDLMTAGAAEILQIRVISTWVHGVRVH